MNYHPLKLLDLADQAISLGDHDGGSILLWRATEAALRSLADYYGQPHDNEDDLMHFAKWLDVKHNHRGIENWHLVAFFAAGSFMSNARWHYEDWEEMRYSVPNVHKFVKILLSYREKAV